MYSLVFEIFCNREKCFTKKENNKSEPIDLHRMALLCSRRYRIDPVGLFELVTFRKPSTFLKRQVFCLFALFYSFFQLAPFCQQIWSERAHNWLADLIRFAILFT